MVFTYIFLIVFPVSVDLICHFIFVCVFVLPHPQASQHSLTHEDHVKWKRQRCFMSLYPRSPFFSIGRRHLISQRLKIDSLRPLFPPSSLPPYLSPLCSGFYWKVSLRYAHSLPKGFPYARQSPVPPFRVVCLCVRERHQTPLWYKTDREFLVFLGSDPDKKIPRFYHLGFQSWNYDLRTHQTVSQSHRTMSIFENGLLWSVWETASVFGHWVEHFWEVCIIRAAQEGLRYFSKGSIRPSQHFTSSFLFTAS